MIDRIALATDFGRSGPYVGQMKLRLSALLPGVPVFDLVSDLPPFLVDLAAYLLPNITRDVPRGTLFVCVVDPGVGGGRGVLAMEADGRWYVGPDNGLLSIVARRAERLSVWQVAWRPDSLSSSFHGRDLFCPLAAMLAKGEQPDSLSVSPRSMVGANWPDELAKVVYVDGYGNLVTGVRAAPIDREVRLLAAGEELAYARTFCEVPRGMAFWYENSFGLVELAVNQGRADFSLGLGPGDPIDGFDGSQSG